MPKYVDVLAEYRHLPKDTILEALVWCVVKAERLRDQNTNFNPTYMTQKHVDHIKAQCMKLAKVFSLRSHYKSKRHPNQKGSYFNEKWDHIYANQLSIYSPRKSIFWEHVVPEEMALLLAVEHVHDS